MEVPASGSINIFIFKFIYTEHGISKLFTRYVGINTFCSATGWSGMSRLRVPSWSITFFYYFDKKK